MKGIMEKMTNDLGESLENMEIISQNTENVDTLVNKIAYLRSHHVHMMFKDAVVLKKEKID